MSGLLGLNCGRRPSGCGGHKARRPAPLGLSGAPDAPKCGLPEFSYDLFPSCSISPVGGLPPSFPSRSDQAPDLFLSFMAIDRFRGSFLRFLQIVWLDGGLTLQ